MKKVQMVVCILFALFSCESITDNAAEENVTLTDEEMITQQLVQSGFSTRNIAIVGDKVVVHSDGVFNKEDLIEDFKKSKRSKQYSTNYIVSQSKAGDIKVRFSGVSSSVKSAFQYAFARWSEISGSKLRMREVSSGADITVSNGLLPWGALAQASFPSSSGAPGPTINVSYFIGWYGLSTAEMRFMAVHELGHCIGYRHTNWFDRNSDGNQSDSEGVSSYGANHIPGTPTGLDPNSIMNAYVAPWVGFGNYDEIATRYLYPNE